MGLLDVLAAVLAFALIVVLVVDAYTGHQSEPVVGGMLGALVGFLIHDRSSKHRARRRSNVHHRPVRATRPGNSRHKSAPVDRGH